MMTSITYQASLTVEDCGTCGGTYALSKEFLKQCRVQGDKKSWNCPYCQASWAYCEGTVGRLESQLAREQADHDQTKAALRNEEARGANLERSRNAIKGQVTKIKNRIADGICPCCQRTFVDLQKHMRSQHPHWEEEIEGKPVE